MTFKYCFFILILLVSLNGVYAFDETLFTASYLDIQTDVKGVVSADYNSRAQFTELKVTYSLFPKEEYSSEHSIITSPNSLTKDPLEFVWTDLKESYVYSIKTNTRHDFITAIITEKADFPQKDIPYELIQYTKPGHFIDSDNRLIREVAHSLAEGETDVLELQLKIAEFVRNEIRYDLATLNAEAKLSASETLVAKEGVCREITLLFIAINRALNIPTRYVSGYAYTNVLGPEGQWAGHAWAEVWIDGAWIPFDVTYGEYMHISPIHIPFSKTAGAQDSKTSFEWRASNVQITPQNPEIKVNVSRKGQNISFGNIRAEPIVTSIGSESYNLIRVTVENPNPYAIAPRIMIGKTQGIEIFGNEKNLLLYPYESREIHFLVRINDDLRRGYVYTFPIVIYSQGFEDAKTEFSASLTSRTYSLSYFEDMISEEPKVFFEEISIDCENQSYYPVGESSIVDCNITNEGNVNYNSLSSCIDSCEYFSLGIQEETEVSMNLNANKGMNVAFLTLYDNGRIISEKRISYEGFIPVIVNVSFEQDDTTWPSGKIMVSSTSPLNGMLILRTETGYYQEFVVFGENIDIPISFPFSAHNSLESSIMTTIVFEDYTGVREETFEHEIKIKSTPMNSIRILLGRLVSFFS